MYKVTDTEEKSLLDFLNSEGADRLKFKFGKLYERADDYSFNNNVKEIKVIHDDHVKAIVSGSRNYKVDLYNENGEIYSECTCPYDGVCKHALAVIIHSQFEEWYFEEVQKQVHFDLTSYLQGLTKQELIQLVLENQTAELVQKLQNKTLSQDDLLSKVAKANKELEKLFKEIDWETDIHWMDERLVSIFKIFDGGWKMVIKEITDLLSNTLKKLNHAIDEGYLYNHYEDESFSGEQLSNLVVSFIKNIPTADKVNVVEELDDLQAEYIGLWNQRTFYTDFFSQDDEPILKQYLFERKIKSNYVSTIYDLIKANLNKEEKEELLKMYALYSQELLIEYVGILEEKFLLKDAELLFEDYFNRIDISKIEKESLMKWIAIKNKLNEPIFEKLNLLVLKFPTKESLQFAISLLPEKQNEFEMIVLEKGFNEFILFLEKVNRIDEAEKILSTKSHYWNDFAFQFYCRNSKIFIEKSTQFMVNRIQQNLPSAGDSYYYTIAHTLKELFRFNPEKASQLLQEIRLNYKRRPNLMSMLREL